MPDDNKVKILFRFYSDVLEEETVETMWADVIDIPRGYYKLDNIPIYAPALACGDIVFATFDENEGMLTYKDTIEYSGSSTVWVVILDDSVEINVIRDEFSALGCPSEKMNAGYFAMEIPPAINYNIVKQKLEYLEQKEVIGYTEPCLADKHRSQI